MSKNLFSLLKRYKLNSIMPLPNVDRGAASTVGGGMGVGVGVGVGMGTGEAVVSMCTGACPRCACCGCTLRDAAARHEQRVAANERLERANLEWKQVVYIFTFQVLFVTRFMAISCLHRINIDYFTLDVFREEFIKDKIV